MAVDVSSLSAVEFLMLLNYEGDPPPDPAFDKIRMTDDEWRKMFPTARPGGDQPDASATTSPEAAPGPAAQAG
jgi:hypothetical protein